MPVTEVCYCTRDEVKRALDLKESARSNPQVDRAIATSARDIDASMKRVFYPTDDTRFFDWPNYQYAAPWKLWLKDNELAVWPAVSVMAGTTVIPLAQIFPGPWMTRPGPPWTFLELDRSTSASFGGNASTPQRSIVIQGTFGFDTNKDLMTTLAASIGSASSTPITVSDSSQVGPGAILIVDTERMQVTDSSMVATGLTLAGGATSASVSDNMINVTGSGTLALYEIILIDGERMYVTDNPATNDYTVKRSYDGTVLAAHNGGATINAPRSLSVIRGALGTTGATHTNGTGVWRHRVPSAVRDLSIGIAEIQLTGEPAAYAAQQTAGGTSFSTIAGGAARITGTGVDLGTLWQSAMQLYRRNARIAAI